LTFKEWLNPFHRSEASVSFNRLFSDQEHDSFFDASALTNCWEWCLGASATPVESIELWASVQYMAALEGFDRPRSLHFGNWALPLAPTASFWTESGEKDLGWQATIGGSYNYSEDLSFEVGYTHLFAGDGLDNGAFIDENGLRFVGGRDNDDADYFYGYTCLQF
ncbi:MAG: hypothetical protein RBU21_17790, partial [FCB group bacterium]|nr:hypothetical protein [FCB group bacterium]